MLEWGTTYRAYLKTDEQLIILEALASSYSMSEAFFSSSASWAPDLLHPDLLRWVHHLLLLPGSWGHTVSHSSFLCVASQNTAGVPMLPAARLFRFCQGEAWCLVSESDPGVQLSGSALSPKERAPHAYYACGSPILSVPSGFECCYLPSNHQCLLEMDLALVN